MHRFAARESGWLGVKQLATGGAFTAVGFGHVLGADGLVARLTASGHRVRRVE